MKHGLLHIVLCCLVLAANAQITVTVPSVQASVGEMIEVPVRLDGVENGTPIQAFEFVLSGLTSNLRFQGGRFNGSLVDRSGWTYSCNTAINKCLGFSGPSQVLRSSGTLVNLQFAVVASGQQTEVRLTNFRLNGGNPSHQPVVPSFFISITGTGTQNSPPESPILTGPTTTMVGGHPEDESVRFDWESVSDPDGDHVTYSVQFGLARGLADPFITMPVEDETELSLNVRQMGGIMAAAFSSMGQNVAVGQSVDLFAQVIAFDGRAASGSNVWPFTAIRAEIVGADQEPKNQGITLRSYPNPAKNEIAISWTSEMAQSSEIMIADALGRIVYTGTPDSSSMQPESILRMDISAWTPGLYVYRVLLSGPGGKRIMTGRFVKTDD